MRDFTTDVKTRVVKELPEAVGTLIRVLQDMPLGNLEDVSENLERDAGDTWNAAGVYKAEGGWETFAMLALSDMLRAVTVLRGGEVYERNRYIAEAYAEGLKD